MSETFIKTDEFLDFFQKNKDRVWIFLDTETLGFNAKKHQMTEVAAKSVEFENGHHKEVSCYHEKAKLLSATRLRLATPFRGKGMSYRDIMKMTNYGEPIKNREYIEEKKMLSEILEFVDSFENPIIVAHNSSFDIGYLNKRYNIYFDNKNPFDDYEVLDTLKVMKRYFAPLVVTEAKRFNHRWLPPGEKKQINDMRKLRKILMKKKTKKISLRLGNVAEALGLEIKGWHTAKFDVETLISTTEEMLKLFNSSRGKKLYPEKYFI